MYNVPGYTARETLHRSHQSVVLTARSEADGRSVILKILNKTFPTREESARFRREYEFLKDLEIEGVVKAYELINFKNTLVIVLEDCGGRSLNKVPSLSFNKLDSFLEMAIKVSEILGEIHAAHVIHKDINPSNIVWNHESGVVKIIDFGISTRLSRERAAVLNPNVLEGTLAYMSPEQTGRMNRAMDHRTDLYSLGATFYRLLTGRPPFPSGDKVEVVHAHIAKQPVPPLELNGDIPAVLSDIVLKLLAKTVEHRYQSAFGLAHDLKRCLTMYREDGDMEAFPLGEMDRSDKFHIPEKLYGREKETAALMAAFDRISQGGKEIMLVAGYSGIGKSVVVQEVHRPILGKRGYFISGKFDQFKRNIPYDSLIQAFREMVRQLLTETEERIEAWRKALQKALGGNGAVITEVIPEVALIIGKQPPVPQLPPAESNNRFNLVFQNFVSTFAGADHPLVIFLDDLQWADLPSLTLIEELILNPTLHHLMFIGAYRDNEVDATHPLTLSRKRMEAAGAELDTLFLGPLDRDHVLRLIADTMSRPVAECRGLAELCLLKTKGNPFFLNQFLHTLYREQMVNFDPVKRCWVWDEARIAQVDITDNVVDLMVRNLNKLPETTRQVVTLAACIGNRFDLRTLSIVFESSPMKTAQELWPALREGMIVPADDAYKFLEENDMNPKVRYRFLHDRVQQGAYSTIDENLKADVHWKIGRLIIANTTEEEQEERIFEIVNHLNIREEPPADLKARLELVEMNLLAGRKAKASSAYQPAAGYLENALELLPEHAWIEHYQLTFAVYIELAECSFLAHDPVAESYLETTLAHAASDLDRSEVYRLHVTLLTAASEYGRALEIAIQGLSLFDEVLPMDEAMQQQAILSAMGEVQQLLQTIPPQEILKLPKAADQRIIYLMNLFNSAVSASYASNQNIFTLVVLRMTALSLEHGLTTPSPFAFVTFGILLGASGNYAAGYDFGGLALKISETIRDASDIGKLYFVMGAFLAVWRRPYKECGDWLAKAYASCLEVGDFAYANHSLYLNSCHLLYSDKPLPDVLKEVSAHAKFAEKSKNKAAAAANNAVYYAVKNLQGKTLSPETMDTETFSEDACFADMEVNKFQPGVSNFKALKVMLLYIRGSHEKAMQAALESQNLIHFNVGLLPQLPHCFYSALTFLHCYDRLSDQQRELLEGYRGNLKLWSENSPENHAHLHLLVEAEYCRANGDIKGAMLLYERAAKKAVRNGFLAGQAIIAEHTGRFYLGLGLEEPAKPYFLKARHGYLQWGADGKVADLDAEFPSMLSEVHDVRVDQAESGTLTGQVTESLDLSSVMKASQAISSQIVLSDLLRSMISILLENAGAERGFLILKEDGEWMIKARGEADGDIVVGSELLKLQSDIAVGIVKYVVKTGEAVVLTDAAGEGVFSNDPYVVEHKPKSLLCMPIMQKGKIHGILYMENNLSAGAFTEERLELLNLLSSQTAISLENAELYANLEQKVEERTRELNDKNAKILKSIRYAERIQQAILPLPDRIQEAFTESFIIFHPKDIVSGDFYWFHQSDNRQILAVVDCTGHGVPGAFMSMIGNTLLNQIVKERGVTYPAEILSELHLGVRAALKQESPGVSGSPDGMDMGLVCIDHEREIVLFSGAYRPLYLASPVGGQLVFSEIKGDRSSIGGRQREETRIFTTHEIPIQSGLRVYMGTDGFADQPNNRRHKFGTRRLREFLASMAHIDMGEQKQRLETALKDHSGSVDQRDDITLIGIGF